jgi:radical SAM superfamily enzyme YgiQ (UPF0313 family)
MSFKKVLLVKPAGRTGLGYALALIPIGIEYIAASIEDTVDEVKIIDLQYEKQVSFPSFLDSFVPDLVGITMSATEHNSGLKVASIAKKRGIATVAGGYHSTAIPDELLSNDQIDMVIRGEGDLTMRELVQRGSPKGIQGISYKENNNIIHNPTRPLIKNLDSLPFPARHLRRHKYISPVIRGREVDEIHMSRGCWGKCTFCCEPSMSHSRQRYRSPENVMKEIDQVYNEVHSGNPLYILMGDSNFMGDAKRVDRLCDLLSESDYDIEINTMVRADSMASNPAVVKKMCKNKIIHFCMGIESPNLQDLEITHKGINNDIQKKAIQIIREYGGVAAGTFVIGLPNQSEEEIKQFPIYAKQIGLMSAAFGIATPFPGTEFYDSLKKENLIFESDWGKFDENNSVFHLPHISKKRMEELRTFCIGKFWTPDTFFDWRLVTMKRENGKMPLSTFIMDRVAQLLFLANAGSTQQGSSENLAGQLQVFVESMADPIVEERTKNMRIEKAIDMTSFLAILGSQIIQLTISYKNSPITSYIIKTTGNTFEYVRCIPGKQEEATINLDLNIDLDRMRGNGNNKIFSFVRDSLMSYMYHVLKPLTVGDVRTTTNVFRFTLATFVEILLSLERKLPERLGSNGS